MTRINCNIRIGGNFVCVCACFYSIVVDPFVCPTLIVIFSGTNLCSAVILTITASDSCGDAEL